MEAVQNKPLQSSHVIGIDVGGSKLLAHLYDADGRLLRVERRPTGRNTGPERLLTLICAVCDSLGAGAAVGVGFPGLTNGATGTVFSSVILDGWHDVPLSRRISEALGVPCAVDNDVKNAARAEAAIRAPDDGRDMLFVSVGSGIGGALVVDGRLWTGVSGLAGEIGHVVVSGEGTRCRCGRVGCVGPRASGRGIEARLGLPPGGLVAAERDSAPSVRHAIKRAARDLGVAIGSVLNVLNLPLVVIGGGVARLGGYLAMVERSIRAETFPEIASDCRIELARAGYEAGAAGAALLARQTLSPFIDRTGAARFTCS